MPEEITSVADMKKIGGESVQELARSPDVKDSKDTVVSTFNQAFSLLESADDATLSPEERWTKKSVKEAQDKTIKQDKKTFSTEEYDRRGTGGRTSQEEGIPIEGLVKFLSKDIDTLPEDQKQTRLEQIRVLLRNSRQFGRIPGRMESNRFRSRVAYEAKLISEDARATGDPLKDWVLAIKTLNRRLELQIPDDEPENQVTPPPIAPPLDAYEGPPEEVQIAPPLDAWEGPEQDEPPAENDQERDRATEAQELLRKLQERSLVLGNAQVVREQEARSAAERRFHEEQGKKSHWWNVKEWVKKTNLRLQQDRYVNKWTKEYMDLARDNGVLFSNMGPVHEGLSQAQLKMATKREKSEAVSAVAEKALRGEMTDEQQSQIKRSTNSEVNNLVYGLITRFAKREISETDFSAEREALLEKLKSNPETAEFFGKAENLTDLADNLLETARDVRTLHQIHGMAVEDLTESIDIQVANLRAVLGTRAEQQVRVYDRIMHRISSTPGAGWFINPATVAVMGSIAFHGASYFASGIRTGFSTAGMALGGPAAPIFGALTGGVFAGVRRSAELNEDFALNERDLESGTESDGKNRLELAKYGAEKAKVTDLISELKALTGGKLSTESRQKALVDRIAEINARESFSDTHNVAMFRFEENTRIAQNRADLLRAKAEAKIALRDSGLTDAQIQEWLNESTARYKTRFLEDKKQQEREFRGYKFKESAKAAGFGFVVGLAASVVTQEATAGVMRALGHHVKDTMAEGIIHGAANLFHHENPSYHPSSDALASIFKTAGAVDLGNHLQAISNPDQHMLSIFDTQTNQAVAQGALDNGTLHSMVLNTGTDQAGTENLAHQLSDAGFRNVDIHESIEHGPSPLDHLKELAAKGEGGKVAMGSYEMSLDSGHHFTVTNGNVVLHGDISPSTGEVTFDQSQNPGADFGELRSFLERNGFGHIVVDKQGGNPVNALEHFRGNHEVEHTNRLLWHDNGTPMHLDSRGVLVGADGKELQFYHHVTPNQGIDLDMSKMISQATPRGFQNWDYTIDNQYNHVMRDIIQNPDGSRTYKNFEFLITPNEAANAAREAIVVHVDATGHAVLPDGSDLHQFFEIRNGQPIQLARFIEVAHVETDANGEIHRTILSTSVGRGIDNITPPPTEIIHTTPPAIPSDIPHYAIDALPPIVDEAPGIPVEGVPRWPLEELGETPSREIIYGPYWSYENLPSEKREFYRNRLSERLRNSPGERLRAEVEIPEYFQRQSPEYLEYLEGLMNQEGMREPMDEECDAIVCMPVYDLGEGRNIQGTLEQYLRQIDAANQQAINPRKFEMILFLNHPKDKREHLESTIGQSYLEGAAERVRAGTPEYFDTAEVIRQFQEAHPELRIRIMQQEFDQRPIWGKIIKPLYDAALLRSIRRNNPTHTDPLIITNDADVVNLSPTYMRDLLQTMDLNEIISSRDPGVAQIDALAGKTDMPNHGYEKEPGFLAAMRTYQFLDTQVRNRPDRSAITQGRNTALRGSTYAAIGGVNDNTDAGADTELGRMINFARGNTDSIQYLNQAWLQTDPRRELEMWRKGLPLAYAWNEWAAMNVYGKDWKDRFNKPPVDPSKLDKEFLQTELNSEVQRWGVGANSREMQRALHFLGFEAGDFHIQNGQIVIDRMDNVAANLQQFIDERRWEKADRRVEQTLQSPNVHHVAGPYYAEYIDYQEFDRIYADLFVSNEYPWNPEPANSKPRIIDLGGHIGMSVLYWKNLRPDANITVVEANPETAAVLERNVQRNNLNNVQVIRGAASSHDGTVDLHMPRGGVDFRWGDFVGQTPVDPSRYDTVQVPAVRLSQQITGPVDLLKIDIEGSELEVLREAEPQLSQVKEIMLEFHNNPGNPTNNLDETLELLTRSGFQYEVRQWNQPVDPATLNRSDTFFLTILAQKPGGRPFTPATPPSNPVPQSTLPTTPETQTQRISNLRNNVSRSGQRALGLINRASTSIGSAAEATLRSLDTTLSAYTLDATRLAQQSLSQLRNASDRAATNLRGRTLGDLTRLSAQTQLLRAGTTRLTAPQSSLLTQRLDTLQSNLNQSLSEIQNQEQPPVETTPTPERPPETITPENAAQETLRNIVTKLDEAPPSRGRERPLLGVDVDLTPEEISSIDDLMNQTTAELQRRRAEDPVYTRFMDWYDQQARTSAIGISRRIIEDPNVTDIVVGTDPDLPGPTLRVPPYIRQMATVQFAMEDLRASLGAYRTGEGRGYQAANISNNLRPLVNFAFPQG